MHRNLFTIELNYSQAKVVADAMHMFKSSAKGEFRYAAKVMAKNRSSFTRKGSGVTGADFDERIKRLEEGLAAIETVYTGKPSGKYLSILQIGELGQLAANLEKKFFNASQSVDKTMPHATIRVKISDQELWMVKEAAHYYAEIGVGDIEVAVRGAEFVACGRKPEPYIPGSYESEEDEDLSPLHEKALEARWQARELNGVFDIEGVTPGWYHKRYESKLYHDRFRWAYDIAQVALYTYAHEYEPPTLDGVVRAKHVAPERKGQWALPIVEKMP